MQLSELQASMSQSLFQPSDTEYRNDPKAYIKSSAVLNAHERLDIYRRSYWSRIVDSFYEDFPGLHVVLGEKQFNSLCYAYLENRPSRSFTLRDLGQFLEQWLIENPYNAGENLECALDMIRLEWAHIMAFDAEEKPPLGIAELATAGARTRFGLQPYVQQLRVNYPVDDIRIATDDGAKNPNLSRSTAIIHLVVHRHDMSVHYLTISQEEWSILSFLSQGFILESAILETFKTSLLDEHEQAKLITASFHRWAQLGWLCQPGEST